MNFDSIFNALTAFPKWLGNFDALNIPAWVVMLAVAIGIASFIFAVREFLSWFLKTNSIVDEIIRLESLVRDLQGELTALEKTVDRLQATALSAAAAEQATQAPAPSTRQFRLDN